MILDRKFELTDGVRESMLNVESFEELSELYWLSEDGSGAVDLLRREASLRRVLARSLLTLKSSSPLSGTTYRDLGCVSREGYRVLIFLRAMSTCQYHEAGVEGRRVLLLRRWQSKITVTVD